MLTIFTIQKSPATHINRIQQQAVESWKHLKGDKRIILFGEDLKKNKNGTPYLNDAFRAACNQSIGNILLYVNADIILTSDVIDVISIVENAFSDFLIVGQRIDIPNVVIDYNKPNWEISLREKVAINGKLHPAHGIDYFIFTKSMIEELSMPSFVVGRPAWDNWMIARCKELKYPVIDATGQILAVHQNHDYNHLRGGVVEMRKGEEAQYNIQLAGDRLQTIEDADYHVKDLL